jgi:mannose-6-phosphate isomerase
VRRTGSAHDSVVPLFGPDAEPFFRADRITAPADLDAGFAVLVVLRGAGRLRTENGGTVDLRRGETLVVPHAAGGSAVDGDVLVVRCQPPTPFT